MSLETIKEWLDRTDKCAHIWENYSGLKKTDTAFIPLTSFVAVDICHYCFTIKFKSASGKVFKFRSPCLEVEDEWSER